MATISLGNNSPAEGEVRNVDLKQATVHVQPMTLDTPSSTPATTPEQNSPSDEVMAGKKGFSVEQPMDRARELASKLTLEEQVRKFLFFVGRSFIPLSVNLELERRRNI
jgi:beta-glucosidase